MPSDETIALDPVEFIPERTELALDALGLAVREAEWGDSEHELFLVRQKLGEIPADRHPPNRTVTIKLMVKEEGPVSLAEAAQALQMKVGIIQEKGGWVRRDPDSEGSFAVPVGAVVHTAVLGGLHGWLMAHRSKAPDVTLVLTTGPYMYGTKEKETATFTELTKRQVIYTVANYLGTAPGLKRVTIKNKSAFDWQGLLAAWESHDYSSATTADLVYEAEALKILNGTKVAEPFWLNGSVDSGEVVRVTCTSFWRGVMGSEIGGVGHMTHVGPRRIHARVYDGASAETKGMKEIRLEWRALGSTRWTINRAVTIQSNQGAVIIDLGAARPERRTLGNQQWEWRISVRTNGTSGTTLDLDLFWIMPTEQFLQVQNKTRLITPNNFKAYDEFDQAAGALNGKALPDGTGNWVTTGSAKGDFETNGSGAVKRAVKEDADWRRAEPPAAAQSIVCAKMSFMWSAIPTDATEKVLRSELYWGSEATTGMLAYYNTKVLGSRFVFFGGQSIPFTWEPGVHYTFTLLINMNNYAFGWITRNKELPTGPPEFVTFNTGFGVAQKTRFADIYTGAQTIERLYTEFQVWIPELDAITFDGRSAELRSDGVFRQAEVADIWGRLVPDGFLPTAQPSGLEERPTRGIIVPTRSDLESLSDVGEASDIEVVEKYFPGYHFASEAT